VDKTTKILDLSNHIDKLNHFFSREKDISLYNSSSYTYELISSIDKCEIKLPVKIDNLDYALLLLNKQGVLSLEDISNFIKIIRYFKYLLSLKLDNHIKKWVNKIKIPDEILSIENAYNDKYKIKNNYSDELLSVYTEIDNLKSQIRYMLNNIISKGNKSDYLVDSSIHFRKNQDCLLVRSGYSHYVKANIIDRSKNGFLYIVPNEIKEARFLLDSLNTNKDIILLKISREFSSIFYKHILFLKYINKNFDFFDSIIARVHFAKSNNLSFLVAKKDNDEIKIKDFHHPAVKNSKAINVEMSKNILIITGVNAGGKTVLLKSILAVALMSKYLIPMRIDGYNSKIRNFKNITAIISDMQNINAGISTFASRMIQISKKFEEENSLVGIDECELGTDSEEASCLFKAIFDGLSNQKHTIIITTHHKKLASLMIKEENCELLAAIYDEENEKPTYNFHKGVVGKSFAFETAKRYNIPHKIVKEAKKIYGTSGESLNNLIEKTSTLEQYLIEKKEKINKEYQEIAQTKKEINQLKEKIKQEYNTKRNNLINTYEETISTLKKTAKTPIKKIHREINKSHKKIQNLKITKEKKDINVNIGDIVKYKGIIAEVVRINNKYISIKAENMAMRVSLNELELSRLKQKKQKKVSIKIEKPAFISLELDLHGQRVEEALINTEKFILSAILNNLHKVSIVHGFGSGKLSFAIRQYLEMTFPSLTLSYGSKNKGGNGVTFIEL
jgi:DNA mismatch repair protein MutS2